MAYTEEAKKDRREPRRVMLSCRKWLGLPIVAVFAFLLWPSVANTGERVKRLRLAYAGFGVGTEYAKQWRDLHSQEIKDLEIEWKTFKDTKLNKLSVEAKRGEQYHHVYRMACEAAHMGDLDVYMPPQSTEGGLQFSDLSFLRAYVCLKFGIILACDLLHDASDALKMGLDQQINSFRERWRAIIALNGIPGAQSEGGNAKGV